MRVLPAIEEERPLTAAERELVAFILERGDDRAKSFLADVHKARVVERCGCGCASVDLAVGGHRLTAPAGLSNSATSTSGWAQLAVFVQCSYSQRMIGSPASRHIQLTELRHLHYSQSFLLWWLTLRRWSANKRLQPTWSRGLLPRKYATLARAGPCG